MFTYIGTIKKNLTKLFNLERMIPKIINLETISGNSDVIILLFEKWRINKMLYQEYI